MKPSKCFDVTPQQDYDEFDLANEVDTLEQFLKVELPPEDPPVEEEKVFTIADNISTS